MKTPLFLLFALVALSARAETRVDLAKKLWETKLQKTGGKPIPAEHYPTEEALMFLSAYDFTREASYADQSARQLELAHNQTKLGMLMTPHMATRDYQARQIYNFYLAYRILGDGRYLKWSDEAGAAMLKIIPRAKHTIAGETHTLFAAGYIDPANPPSRIRSRIRLM